MTTISAPLSAVSTTPADKPPLYVAVDKAAGHARGAFRQSGIYNFRARQQADTAVRLLYSLVGTLPTQQNDMVVEALVQLDTGLSKRGVTSKPYFYEASGLLQRAAEQLGKWG